MATTLLTQEQFDLKEAPEKYFAIENLFNEIEDSDKGTARDNIGAVSIEDLFDSSDIEKYDPELHGTRILYWIIKKIVLDNLNKDNFTGFDNLVTKGDLLDKLEQELKPYYKEEAEGIFKSAHLSPNRLGYDAYSDSELVTKGAIDNKLRIETYNLKKNIQSQIENQLLQYLKIEELKEKVSNIITNEVIPELDKIKKQYIKSDGTISFTKPQAGKDPTQANHLTTRRYVDKKVSEHESRFNHNFEDLLTIKLAKYALKDNVLTKAETYTRSEINRIIDKVVDDTVKEYIKKAPTFDDLGNILDQIYYEYYVKQDGSTPFLAPQKGKDAKENDELVTLGQVNKALEEVKNSIEQQECYWTTSGPVETTVGFVEDGSRLPDKLTLQEIMDKIFYQKRVSVTVPEVTETGQYVDVTVCVSDPSDIDGAEIFYRKTGEEEWVTEEGLYIEREEFEESLCVTRRVGPIYDDTDFDFKIYQSNGSENDEYTQTKLALPVFAGILPEWKFATNVTYTLLQKLVKLDPNNNAFYDKTEHMRELEHTYDFDLNKSVKLIVAVPYEYRDLKEVTNGVQTFKADSFDELSYTTFYKAGKDVAYKIYIYKQPLVKFNSTLTFKFQ